MRCQNRLAEQIWSGNNEIQIPDEVFKHAIYYIFRKYIEDLDFILQVFAVWGRFHVKQSFQHKTTNYDIIKCCYNVIIIFILGLITEIINIIIIDNTSNVHHIAMTSLNERLHLLWSSLKYNQKLEREIKKYEFDTLQFHRIKPEFYQQPFLQTPSEAVNNRPGFVN